MPRQQRLIVPGVAVHIVQRGNNRSACFFAPGDYRLYVLHLRELAAALDCAVHAFCLMTNHVHLLVTPASSDACKALMRNLGQRYVQYINRTYGRTGTLWEGRYRSCLAQSARYVLACYRYIELNPVRAGIVVDPADYPWSSFHSNAEESANAWLAPHPEYVALGDDPVRRRAVYRTLIQDGIEQALLNDIRQATCGGYALGSKAFKSELTVRSGRRVSRGRPGRKSGSEPDSRNRPGIGL